jgi:hypothetical protein
MKNYIKAVFLIIVLLFLVTFGIKNNQPVRLNYIFIGMLIGINNRFQQRRKIKILEKLTNELKAEAQKEEKEEQRPDDHKVEEKAGEEKAAEDQTATQIIS